MKKKLLSILLIGLVLTGGIAGCGNKTVTFKGHIIDQHCAEKKKGEDESLKCVKMEKCEQSGYGIAVDNGDGTEKFIKFNGKGHDKAKEFINTIPEDQEKIGEVEIKGHYDDDKNFEVEEINKL